MEREHVKDPSKRQSAAAICGRDRSSRFKLKWLLTHGMPQSHRWRDHAAIQGGERVSGWVQICR